MLMRCNFETFILLFCSAVCSYVCSLGKKHFLSLITYSPQYMFYEFLN